MEIYLTEEQKMIRDMARDFADNELEPVAADIDRNGAIPPAILTKMGQLGFMGLMVPEEYGGVGLDSVSYAIAVEQIGRVCASTATVLSVQNSLACHGLLKYGNEEQKQRFLTRLATGQAIGAFALTEPQAGSDAAAILTSAVRDGDEYVINGGKIFITSAAIAGLFILFTTTDRSLGHRGITAFVVEPDTPGFALGKEEHKLGIRGTSTCELILEDCRVPVENRIGEEGEGFKLGMLTLDAGRIGIAAEAVGIAQGAFEKAVEYARTREQFGRPIANFQGIQWMLADMDTRIEAARLLTYQAACLKDLPGVRYTREAAMAKLFASETAAWVTSKAVQIFGGYGYMQEYPVERMYRDAKITEIYEGTSEIQRTVIGKLLLSK